MLKRSVSAPWWSHPRRPDRTRGRDPDQHCELRGGGDAAIRFPRRRARRPGRLAVGLRQVSAQPPQRRADQRPLMPTLVHGHAPDRAQRVPGSTGDRGTQRIFAPAPVDAENARNPGTLRLRDDCPTAPTARWHTVGRSTSTRLGRRRWRRLQRRPPRLALRPLSSPRTLAPSLPSRFGVCGPVLRPIPDTSSVSLG
jgi:hypothetical protein